MNPMETKFIADIGSNHNQSWSRCKALIKEAARINCWGVKFQLFDAEKLYAPGFANIEELKKRELPVKWIKKIARLCKKLKIKFGCTPFYIEAVEQLEKYVDFFKISSFDIKRKNLIYCCAIRKQPLLISCGLASDTDIVKAKHICELVNKRNVYFLHCVSDYPTHCNNSSVNRILENLLITGYSDHTTNQAVICKAVNCGAEYIEFHFDLNDQKGLEYDCGHCWLPDSIDSIIFSIQNGFFTKESLDIISNSCGIDFSNKNIPFKKMMQRASGTDGMRPSKYARMLKHKRG